MKHLATLLLALLLASPAAFAADREAGVKQAVESFYGAYIKAVNGFIERKDRSEDMAGPATWKPYLTKRCYAAYLKVLKTPDLDYDPLLQSNNVPDAFAVKNVRFDGDTAYVSAKYAGYVDTTPPLELRLKEVDGKWLVDAIGDLNK